METLGILYEELKEAIDGYKEVKDIRKKWACLLSYTGSSSIN